MKCFVTGAAGFIGSTLSEKLLSIGHSVIGVDCFTDYYDIELKKKNLLNLHAQKDFKLIEKNILDVDLASALDGVDVIFHQAAQAGVRASWGGYFSIYTNLNVLGTQRLLEACKGKGITKFVYASSSSVYGDTPDIPMKETSYLQPVSPYGVSKLAAEHLCYLYYKNFGIPTVSLRYFTVFGPRQRPDMSFNRFIKATLLDKKISLYGDGEQTRDFTFISDIVDANIAAMERGEGGSIFNIGGGVRVSMNQVIEMLEEVMGKKMTIDRQATQKGDMRHTYADTTMAQEKLLYQPKISLKEGLTKEVAWLKELIGDTPK